MRGSLRIAVAFLALAIVVGCAGSDVERLLNTDRANLRVGVAGEVRQGPIRPVERAGEDNTGPLEGAAISVQDSRGAIRGRVVSDAAGEFYVELPPGTYVFTPLRFRGRQLPAPGRPMQVVVLDGAIAQVKLEYDTGIR
jgi:hypothetical protein